MKVLFFFFLFIVSLQPLLAQKSTSRSYDAAGIENIVILADEVYHIRLRTTENNLIFLSSQSRGEYYNDIELEMERYEKKMVLTSRFTEHLQGGFDKLSAHKVFSMDVTLEIPEGIDVYIRSNVGSLLASGNYRNLQVELRNGYCILREFSGNAAVNTYNGSIDIETAPANVDAATRNGILEVTAGMKGDYDLELQSINGDIMVREN